MILHSVFTVILTDDVWCKYWSFLEQIIKISEKDSRIVDIEIIYDEAHHANKIKDLIASKSIFTTEYLVQFSYLLLSVIVTYLSVSFL